MEINSNQQPSTKSKFNLLGVWIPLGIVMGVGIGVAFGNPPIGIGIGISIGVAINLWQKIKRQ